MTIYNIYFFYKVHRERERHFQKPWSKRLKECTQALNESTEGTSKSKVWKHEQVSAGVRVQNYFMISKCSYNFCNFNLIYFHT